MPGRPNEWKRKVEGVCWADVWEWADDIYSSTGLHTEVTLCPPILTNQSKQGTLTVKLTKRLPDGKETCKMINWKVIPQSRPEDAPSIALRMLVEMNTALEREVYEAERAALSAGAMF